jgi:hypothetical protein
MTMSQLGEAVWPALLNDELAECPFPHDERDHSQINDLSNSSKVLAGQLGSVPRDEVELRIGEKEEPDQVVAEAHHVIPGESLKSAKPLLKIIDKGTTGSKVKGDVGYRQNDKRNGIFLPGKTASRAWGTIYEPLFAFNAMDKQRAQFHMWSGAHSDYNRWWRQKLGTITLKTMVLYVECKKCRDKYSSDKIDPPYRLVDTLYGLAGRITPYLRYPVRGWRIPLCTSDYSLLRLLGHTPESLTGGEG